jgi:predicted permease
VRQLLTESLLLAGAGGALGVALAVVGVRALVAFAPPGVPRLELAGIDAAALAFACAVALVAGAAAGLVPALRASRVAPADALAGGSRDGVEAGGRDRVRGALVAVEVAFALALLACAGLLIRSGLALGRVDPGFEPEGVLSARLALPAEGYPDAPRVRDAFSRLVEDLRAAPGVVEVALVNQVPLGGGSGSNGLLPEGRPFDPANLVLASFRLVTPEYLRSLGIPLLAGRGLGPGDRAGTAKVMLVNETLAREAFPGEPAIGRRIACCEEPVDGQPPWKEIVGVVGDVHGLGLDRPDRATFYLPLGQEPPEAWGWLQRTMLVVVRGHGDPAALTGTVRAAVRRLDPELPIYDVASLDQRLRGSLARERFNTLLLTALGGLGIVLAAVGIYGVIAYWVGRRTREIGVRLALGASRGRVLALVLRQTAAPVAAGLVLGLALAAAGSRLLASQLYGVPPGDPVTLATVTAALAAAALTAAWLPARRALAVDPSRALRVS